MTRTIQDLPYLCNVPEVANPGHVSDVFMIKCVTWEDRSGRIDPFSGVLVWRQVADDVAADIESGRLGPGSKLPGETELASLYGVARTTVRRAVENLRDRGLVVTAHGRGTFVLPIG